MLSYYAGQLPAVEINNTFYRMPKASVMEDWATKTPAAFVFAIKASRRITHFARLKDAGDHVDYLFKNIAGLGDKAGPVLFQLPPNFKKDLDRLKGFLGILPPKRRVTFEFRHPSWFEADVVEALSQAGAALCVAETNADEKRARDHRYRGLGLPAAPPRGLHQGEAAGLGQGHRQAIVVRGLRLPQARGQGHGAQTRPRVDGSCRRLAQIEAAIKLLRRVRGVHERDHLLDQAALDLWGFDPMKLCRIRFQIE